MPDRVRQSYGYAGHLPSGEILSCGGWIADSIRELPNLEQVVLVGPDERLFPDRTGALGERFHFSAGSAWQFGEGKALQKEGERSGNF